MLNPGMMLLAVIATLISCTAARAQLLKIVQVNAPKVNCVFQTDCNIPVSDSTGYIALPILNNPKAAWLQSRTSAASRARLAPARLATNTGSA